jgi:hypothetical protein
MPYLENEDGALEFFDYDPDKIAEHVYNKRRVYPDNGLSPDELERHSFEIQSSLQKLWRDQTTRTAPESMPLPQWRNESPEVWRPPQKGDMNFMNVEPNPTVEYPIRGVRPYHDTIKRNRPVIAKTQFLHDWKG